MDRLHLVIADDEPAACERLRFLLASDRSVEIVGECRTGTEALETIRRCRPEAAFLDMQMPGLDGLEVVRSMAAPERPAIVFATAHERYAVEAFALRAVDYLLKPFDGDRLQLSLRRVREFIENRGLADLAGRLSAPRPGTSRLVLRTDGRVVFIRPDEIIWIEGANNRSVVHLVDAPAFPVRLTLAELEQQLGASGFVRINRSALVAASQVAEVQTVKFGDHEVVLRTGERLPLSRGLRGRLEMFIGPGH